MDQYGNFIDLTGAPPGGTTGALAQAGGGTAGGTGTYDYQNWDTLGDALGAFADYDWGGALGPADANMGDLAGQYLEAGAWPVGIGDDTYGFRTDAPIGGANEVYNILAGGPSVAGLVLLVAGLVTGLVRVLVVVPACTG